MTERTTVRLPEELVAKAKRKALAEGRTLTALIEDGLRRVLNEQARPHAVRKVSLPVSSAGGGLMPGIDIDNAAALQEMDDLEYLRRRR
jgi:hypothetical protein